MDVKINFNLTENMESFTTDKISGFLEGVIVDSIHKVDIIIRSELGYLILHEREHEGTKYLAPRAHQTAPQRNLQHQYQFDKFLLDEPVEIIVSGLKDNNVSVILRIS